MNALTLHAPAKLNLSLRVLGARDDGFCAIDTLIVKLPGLADTLEIAPADGFSFACSDPSLPADDTNLVVKAARAFATAAGVTPEWRLSLTKNIPHGAGLGGGSSDAAATLRGLNAAHEGLLDEAKLHELAAGLGSDVPAFLTDGAVRCTGRGEVVRPEPGVPAMPVVLLKPAFAVDTAWAYGRWRERAAAGAKPPAVRQHAGVDFVNDLEPPVFGKFLFLAELKRWLEFRSEVALALMSGSGATVVAVLRDAGAGQALMAAARQELDPGLWGWCGLTGAAAGD